MQPSLMSRLLTKLLLCLSWTHLVLRDQYPRKYVGQPRRNLGLVTLWWPWHPLLQWPGWGPCPTLPPHSRMKPLSWLSYFSGNDYSAPGSWRKVVASASNSSWPEQGSGYNPPCSSWPRHHGLLQVSGVPGSRRSSLAPEMPQTVPQVASVCSTPVGPILATCLSPAFRPHPLG